MMTIAAIYYLIEGIAVTFLFLTGLRNALSRGNRLKRVFGGVLLFWASQYIVSIVFTADFVQSRQWSNFVNALDMTAEPTCCFLLMELCQPGWLTWRKVVVHELPFVALAAAYALTMREEFYLVLLSFFVVYGCATFVVTLYRLKRYDQFLREHYSYEENINLNWVYIALFTFLTLMFVYAFSSKTDTHLTDIIYIVASVFCWGLADICVSRQGTIVAELEATAKEEQTRTMATANKAMATQVLAEAIETRFLKPKLFLNPKLKLGDMAAAVGTNRTYLSRHLNEELHTTFYDYINSLRLDHARHQMDQPDHDNVTAIASASGFNSYSTFRRAFHAKFGVPPTSYKGHTTP